VLGEQARAQMVAALAAVDYVVIWRRPELDSLFEALQPDRVERSVPGERNIIEEVRRRYT
jgi:bifunctional ADP-heptose synthase (sugar kinase/adenylyltransferase)